MKKFSLNLRVCGGAIALLAGCASPPRYVVQDAGAPDLSRAQVTQAAADAGTAEREFKNKVAAIDSGLLETKIEIIAMKLADYPRAARAHSIEGTVVVEFVVGTNGLVEEVWVVRSAHPLLEKAALDAVANYRFRPMKFRGEPARVKFSQEIPFMLSN